MLFEGGYIPDQQALVRRTSTGTAPLEPDEWTDPGRSVMTGSGRHSPGHVVAEDPCGLDGDGVAVLFEEHDRLPDLLQRLLLFVFTYQDDRQIHEGVAPQAEEVGALALGDSVPGEALGCCMLKSTCSPTGDVSRGSPMR